MTTVAIVQARMGSSRLPGKVLMDLAGRPALWHVIDRLRHARRLDAILVATTTAPADDALADFCAAEGLTCYRGSEQDVLDRYYQAARSVGADHIVRITADCPAVDPEIVDAVIEGYFAGGYDHYGLGGEFPDGLDCVVFSFPALEATWREATLPSEREHVCPYMQKHTERFRFGILTRFHGLAHHRWTLDEPRDYAFLSALFARLYDPQRAFTTADVLALLAREPELGAVNADIIRNEGYLKSLEADRAYLQQQEAAGRPIPATAEDTAQS